MEINDANFEEKVIRQSKKKVVVADFWASWCIPCNMLAPILDKIVESYKGRVMLAKINIDKCPETAERFEINAIPDVRIFKNGKVVGQFIGIAPEEIIKDKIKKALA